VTLLTFSLSVDAVNGPDRRYSGYSVGLLTFFDVMP
jgi:hypothetical protein